MAGKAVVREVGEGAGYEIDEAEHPHEAHHLKLDCAKATARLEWRPRWDLEQAIDRVIEWTNAYRNNGNVREICRRQIREYSLHPIQR